MNGGKSGNDDEPILKRMKVSNGMNEMDEPVDKPMSVKWNAITNEMDEPVVKPMDVSNGVEL